MKVRMKSMDVYPVMTLVAEGGMEVTVDSGVVKRWEKARDDFERNQADMRDVWDSEVRVREKAKSTSVK